MFLIVGALVVVISIFGGYMASEGHIAVLWQPFEAIMIVGSAIGAFIIANPKAVLKKAGKAIGVAMKGSRYTKASYLELLSLLYTTFKLVKSKGMLALEQHVENPNESTLFQQFPNVFKDHEILVFLCDYLRLMTLGTENAHEFEALLDEEIETHHKEHEMIAGGRVRIVATQKDLQKFRPGEVLVADTTSPDWGPVMKGAAAIVTNRGGRTCHAAIVARELGIPAVVGTGDATHNLKAGMAVTVCCAEGDAGHV